MAAAVTPGLALDADTQTALAVAGVSQTNLRLTGDTFQQIKGKYRKMPKPQRLQELSHLQLHIAAIYAVENEDMQRQVRLEQQEKRHRQIDDGRRSSGPEKRARRESAMEDDGSEVQSPTRRRTLGRGRQQDAQALQLDHQDQHLDPQLMAQQSHSPDDVDPFLHCWFPLSVSVMVLMYSRLCSAIPGFDAARTGGHAASRPVPSLPAGVKAVARSVAGADIGGRQPVAYASSDDPSWSADADDCLRALWTYSFKPASDSRRVSCSDRVSPEPLNLNWKLLDFQCYTFLLVSRALSPLMGPVWAPGERGIYACSACHHGSLSRGTLLIRSFAHL